jgi:hypothetical protein
MYTYNEDQRHLYEAIYDILVEEAGANPNDREDFVLTYTRKEYPTTEYRFCGSLGFGGKFWRNQRFGLCPFYVSCYPEDNTRERKVIIEHTNKALAALA